MAEPNRLKALEAREGPLTIVIPRALEQAQGEQGRAAAALGISAATLSTWLKSQGYVLVKRWVKGTNHEQRV